MADQGRSIIIKGVTTEGRKFRPSDWAERLTTAVATLGSDRRIRFHPRVHMATLDGIHCVMVDAVLKDEEPMLYHFLLNFGRENNLQMEERA